MAAFSSFGSTLKVGAAAGGTYSAPTTAVGEITSLSVDGMKLNTIDITTLTDRFRKFTPGLIDSGSISLEVNLDPDDAQQGSLIDQLDNSANTTAPTFLSFLVEFGSSSNKGATLSGVGIVTDFSIKGGLDAAVTASFTIKWSGMVTFTDVD